MGIDRVLSTHRAVFGIALLSALTMAIPAQASDSPPPLPQGSASVGSAGKPCIPPCYKDDAAATAAARNFGKSVERDSDGKDDPRLPAYLAAFAMQQSNFGHFQAADVAFARAATPAAMADPVLSRILRNYQAQHYLNQKKLGEAVAELDRPVAVHVKLKSGEIDADIANAMNGGNGVIDQLAGGLDNRLTPTELAQMLDAQALQLRGIAYRLNRDYAQARISFDEAVKAADAVRGGRVGAVPALRTMIQFDLALIARAEGDMPKAEKLLVAAVQDIEIHQPNTFSAVAAKARLAGFYAGAGQIDRAMTIYADVIAAADKMPGAMDSIRDLLRPYRRLLAQQSRGDPKAVAPATPSAVSNGN